MGIKKTTQKYDNPPPVRQGIADALFTATQQKVLTLLFGQPERSFYASEIIALAGAGSGAVQRELKRLSESGLLTVCRIGNQKHFQANKQSPIFDEIKQIVAISRSATSQILESAMEFAFKANPTSSLNQAFLHKFIEQIFN